MIIIRLGWVTWNYIKVYELRGAFNKFPDIFYIGI